MGVKLVTDSTSYISEELIHEYDISITSLNVILQGKSYREANLDHRYF